MPEGNTRASRGRRIVLMIICVAALAGGGGAYWRWAQATEGARAPRLAARAAVSVSVEVVGRSSLILARLQLADAVLETSSCMPIRLRRYASEEVEFQPRRVVTAVAYVWRTRSTAAGQ